MVVMCPADDTEARKAVKAAIEHQGPVYIRFGESGPAGELVHKYQLDTEGIYQQVKAFVKG